MQVMKLDQLETPCLLLDESRLERNVARMRAHLDSLGVNLRLHVKTAKSIDVVRRVLRSPQDPITVSTLKEAEYFLANGVQNILYAVGMTPNKLEHVTDLRRRGAGLALILDSVEAAHAVAAHARSRADRIPVLIEIDCDGHRSGMLPGDPALIEAGRVLADGGCELRGVMTHAGGSYNCTTVAAIKAMALQERDAVLNAAKALRTAELPCPVVSVGSTPTATCAGNLTGVTEVRAGVFVFFDLVMAGLQVCTLDDIALSVLASVIGHQREKGWIIVDAGWMAMSRDRGSAKQKIDQGYGLVCNAQGEPYPDLIMTDANQEHGVIALRQGARAALPDLPLGTLLRILPNHACATGAQHQAYQVVREGSDTVGATWPRFAGW
ncbi:MAG: DSD1 family PLP-dependent enzyme [Burkholderiales bacterium]|nr:DSD1 family PLP-dependent enzyme [Burkholderiales bacterium]